MNTLGTEKANLIEKINDIEVEEKLQNPEIDWDYVLFEDGCVSGKRARYREKMIKSLDLGNSCYFPDTNQVCIQISMYQGKEGEVDLIAKSLRTILPYIKPIKEQKIFKIFEHTCSENGICQLFINEDENKFDIVRTRYSRERVVHSSKTLEEALAYIQKYYYYE